MKKLFVVLLVALLAVALVACGGDDTTTKAPTTTTAPGTTAAPAPSTTTKAPTTTTAAPTTTTSVLGTTEAPGTTTVAPGTTTVAPSTTTEAPATTTEAPGTTEAPMEGLDILFGEYEYATIDPFWSQGMYPCAFENFHKFNDYRWALVFVMNETDDGIYEQLVITDQEKVDEGLASTETGFINTDFEWVVTIDGVDYQLENFQFLNSTTSGYIRADLGPDFEITEEIKDYTVFLKIYDAATKELKFYANMSDEDMLGGPFTFEKPADVVRVDDPNRDPSHVMIPATDMEALDGPVGFNADELYNNVFDGRVQSKLCTNNTTLVEGPDGNYYTASFTFKLKDTTVPANIVSYSIVGANDDASYTDRLVRNFKLYGSTDGEDWVEIDSHNLTDEEVGTVTNYGERNYKLKQASTYHYYKIDIVHGIDMFQISEIILWTQE